MGGQSSISSLELLFQDMLQQCLLAMLFSRVLFGNRQPYLSLPGDGLFKLHRKHNLSPSLDSLCMSLVGLRSSRDTHNYNDQTGITFTGRRIISTGSATSLGSTSHFFYPIVR